jgi:autotransporter-associated beta strand protein
LASDPVNWVNSSGQHVAPVAGDVLQFLSAAQTVLQNDLPAGTQLGGIDVNPGPGGTVTITGNNFALPDGGAVTLESGSAAISANITLDGELCAVVNPGSTLTVSGVLSESTPGNGSLDLTGGGQLVLSGANSFTGGTEIQGASQMTLAGGDNRLAPAGDIQIEGGALDLGGYTQTIAGTVWFTDDLSFDPDPNTVQDGTLVLDNSSTEQGINGSEGSGTISANIVVQGGQTAEEWALYRLYTLTIAGNVAFAGHDLFQEGGQYPV